MSHSTLRVKLPRGDMHHKASLGSFATFGDELGFGATLAIRGNDNWTFGGSAAIGGDETTTKVQIQAAGF